ncbi:carboxypeptidase-like regulatory domain-containing protein [Jatrophihabitans sp. YIM 134969]
MRLAPLLRLRPARVAAVAAAVSALGLTAAPAALAAPTTAVISGTVRGAEGNPLGGVTVSAVVQNGPNWVETVAKTRSGSDGRYRITGISPTSGVSVRFDAAGATGGTSATGYADRCYRGAPWCEIDSGRGFTLVAGQTVTGVDVTLVRAGRVELRAVDDLHRGVGGMDVYLYPTSSDQSPDAFPIPFAAAVGATDTNGNVVFARAAPWTSYAVCFGYGQARPVRATPNRDGYIGGCLSQGSDRVTVVTGRTVARSVTLTGGGAVTGRVVDRTGRPVAGASVKVGPYSFIDFPQTTTAADGTFRFGRLRPGADQLCVSADGFRDSCDTDPDSGQIDVEEFRTVGVGRIVLDPLS